MVPGNGRRTDLKDVAELSKEHGILLAVQLASDSNIDAIQALTIQRKDIFDAELVLRIILTYLTETLDPILYTSFVAQVASNQYQTGQSQPQSTIDIATVSKLSTLKAHKKVQSLHLLPLDHSSCPPAVCDDLLTRFLIHRAHRIDTETGVLNSLPQLVDPFLDEKPFLRTWYISTVLPLLRFGYEYYNDNHGVYSLDQLEWADGESGVAMLLSKALEHGSQDINGRNTMLEAEGKHRSSLARDMRGLVGPWMYGYSDRKRRKLNGQDPRRRRLSVFDKEAERAKQLKEQDGRLEDDAIHDWDAAFLWMTRTAAEKFSTVAEAIEEWDGPPDVDLGGYHEGSHLSKELQKTLLRRYAQTAFATVFAAEASTKETMSHSHTMLVRISQLLDYEPPPDLASSIELLPRIDDHKSALQDLPSSWLEVDALLRPKNPLTSPTLETFALLQLLVFSAYLLAELGHPAAISHVARIRLQFDANEQLGLCQRIVHALSTGAKKDELQWTGIRSRFLWLWGWAMNSADIFAQYGDGVFGKIERSLLEKEILKAFLNASCFPLVVKTYIRSEESQHRLSAEDVQFVIIETVLHHYDNASNGNRTRGGMKKASDMISTLRQYFPESPAFRRCEALLKATHALSFYALTLQHGVPFQPVNIRVSSDPITLIEKLLSQNRGSYTKLDDLISIGVNLVSAGVTILSDPKVPSIETSSTELAAQKRKAERRVIGMAIEAALNEDDFETAYSYVVNRLDTTSASTQVAANGQPEDDISWRAALAAGRHKSSAHSLSASSSISTPPALRRLEQRMELLSQALLLAPPSALPEVLNVWRKCEEEMMSLQASENEEESSFDDRADRALPGTFVSMTAPVQPRREVGRGATEEAPMGLFDVARGAAAAFSRTAFPLRGSTGASQGQSMGPPTGHVRNVSSGGSDTASIASESERVRKRDYVANAVTGGLASGLGWVLGATPVNQQTQH
ncbi:secretory pathway Sec39 [Venturia nashicola]|uniref:Secretory pathway Sec39 n=1 Tax=Venturia nashicola TaxID=86259 RepID=A0A4Z1P678_9PEZI|nr:secretory pathway Sec39 [Venturia nashicola]